MDIKLTLKFMTLCILFLHTANKSGDEDIDIDLNHSCENQEHCDAVDQNNFSRAFLTIKDSLDTLWKDILDKDDNDHCTVEELIDSIRLASDVPLSDVNALELAKLYGKFLDTNADTVIDLHEIRFALYEMRNSPLHEFTKKFGESQEVSQQFIQWLKLLIGESPTKYPFYLVKIFQLLDEDLNAKLTWKEIRMTIKLAESFIAIKESNQMDERGKEDLVASIKKKYGQKWLDLNELTALLSEIGAGPYDIFYFWICQYLKEDSEFNSSSVKEETRKHFRNIDLDSNGLITKGELTAALHKHRVNYYTDERINWKWTRADRNQDTQISFNEYVFLENLKHPERK